MIKKVLLTLSMAGLCGIGAHAQSVNPCGTDEVYRQMLLAHPEIAERNEALSREIADKLYKMSKMDLSKFAKTTDGDGTTVYHVPLVFHIVHDYGSEFVSDADIKKCVEDINKVYNKQNADTADVIAPFKGFIHNSSTRYIGNARIQWHLASKDPMGKPTNGITRRRSYLTKTAGDLAKFDQWPPNNYMNVWVIRTMSAAHNKAAAYAYKPATADVIPYWDGVIALYDYLNRDNTISHELGHELNLDHPWGGTNDPKVACGDDDVEDTPPTKGHDPSGGCGDLPELYDTACLYSRNVSVGKLRLDSIRRTTAPFAPILMKDTSTSRGITFKCRTATTIDSLMFYPAAAIGSTYIIGLSRNGVLIDQDTVVTTVIDTAQMFRPKFKMQPTDTATNFKIYFVQNPGAWKDTATPLLAGFPKGQNGTVLIKDFVSGGFYNFFYNWKITYGFFKIYDRDSLVDYPDTTNSQNVMDYTYCSKMFTHGQVERMRAALTSTVGSRSSLITPTNLAATGALDSEPALAPKAEFSVERAVNSGGFLTSEPAYFFCSDGSWNDYNFVFKNRSWQGTPTGLTWTLSNAATTGTSTSSTSVNSKFGTTGWAKITLSATNATGTTEYTDSVYVADPNIGSTSAIGYIYEFNNAAENAKWPIFNYYNNRYKWELSDVGTYDNSSIRYRSYDDRSAIKDLVNGDPAGDYDDFFTPAYDLSGLGTTNGNLNFMYAGAYATNNVTLMKDVLEIAYSTNCGATWNTLKTMKDVEMQTTGSLPPSAGEYRPTITDWKLMSIDLKSGVTPIRDKRVYFRFRYKPSARPIGQYSFASGNNFYIDRVHISDNPLSVNAAVLGDKKVALVPNPTSTNAYVLFQSPNGKVDIKVMDITGKVVYSVTEKVDQHNGRIEIPASAIGVKGVYMVQISGEDNLLQTEKLVVY